MFIYIYMFIFALLFLSEICYDFNINGKFVNSDYNCNYELRLYILNINIA